MLWRDRGQWQLFAPYGFNDLCNGIIRPQRAHLYNAGAASKTKKITLSRVLSVNRFFILEL
ncbi:MULTISPECIES: nucleotidyltransferase family protein [Cyanophyceae]|uniref:nucleotidyltransferase family protein n=1 Tax=Cyanophyceae TaxID=3028117 RepID=UPI001687ED66|nr:nucleotidyltransferase family protein [Trichocoleus sp. FACHB-40]